MRACAAIISLSLLAAGTLRLQAQEAFVVYDTFADGQLSPSLWTGGGVGRSVLDVVRIVKGGELRLESRSYADTREDADVRVGRVDAGFRHDTRITAIRTKVHVDRVSTTACAANPAPAEVAAQIFGAFFNTDTPTANSHVNDVVARLTIGRASNSLDPADRLRVTASVLQCQNGDCSDAVTLASTDMGTVLVGATTAVAVRWLPGSHAFEFRKDADRVQSNYTVSDAAPPGNPEKLLGVVGSVPNCSLAPRPQSAIAAAFNNVAVNASAVQ
jgi:hypothetical protein